MKLREIAHSRTGDKGDTSNISLIAYDAQHYPLLVRQVTALVRWRECVNTMVALGVDSFIELGAGKVLSGLIRRIVLCAHTCAMRTGARTFSCRY